MARKKRRPLPKLCRHSSGQARVKLCGRTFYLGEFGSVEAQRRYADLIQRWTDGGRKPLVETPHVEQVAPLRDLFGQFETYLDSTGRYTKAGKPTSQRGIVRIALREFCDRFGDVRMPKFTESMLLTHRDELEGRRSLSRVGINRKIAHIRAALRWAFGRGMLTRDQWLGVKAIEPLNRAECGARDRKRTKRAVTIDEVEKVAACLPSVPAAMLRLQALTGMRPGEVCAMRWRDIDRTPVVVEDVECWAYNVADGKTAHHGHATSYALGPMAQAILEQFPAAPGAFIFSPMATMAELHEMRRSRRQTPTTAQTEQRDASDGRSYADRYAVSTYRQAVDRGIARAGVAPFTPHEVRHGFLTRACAQFGAFATSSAANHTRVSTTETYLHKNRGDAFRVVVGLERSAEPSRAKDAPDSATG